MKKIPYVVFTGAGASNAIGLPTMKDFFENFLDENRNVKPTHLHMHKTSKILFKKILDSLYSGKTNYDLEEIMGVLYDAKHFSNSQMLKMYMSDDIFTTIARKIRDEHSQKFTITKPLQMNSANMEDFVCAIKNEMTKEYHSLHKQFDRLLYDIERTIRDSLSNINHKENARVYGPFISMLVRDLQNKDSAKYLKTIPFYTTNYDMSIDYCFNQNLIDSNEQTLYAQISEQNLLFYNGFNGNRNGVWSRESYSNAYKGNKISVPYYKLHGSIFWQKAPQSDSVTTGGSIEDKPYSYPHDSKQLYISYPAEKKELIGEPYSFNYMSLERDLHHADSLIIIGFSFRDPKIVEIFKIALECNEDLEIKVVVPEDAIGSCEFHELNQFLAHRSGGRSKIKKLAYKFGDEATKMELFQQIIPSLTYS